jgi:glycosyltransferase involved in cell wall biosynthesis
MNPKVTFILPVYNGLPYVGQAVGGVLSQTEANWQLLIIDDASQDGSLAKLPLASDSRIQVVRNEKNLGLYGTLNKAAALVKTEWVSIVHQDDWLKPNYLADLLSVAAAHPAAQAVWATYDTIDANGKLLIKGLETKRVEVIDPSPSAWVGALQRGCFWIISSSLTRRELLIAEPFRADLPHCADYDWLLRVLRRYQLVYYEQSLFENRTHEGQASARHLSAGRDVWESYGILKENFALHGNDVSHFNAICICLRRAYLIARRAIAAILQGRLKHSLFLWGYVLRFAILLFQRGHRVNKLEASI